MKLSLQELRDKSTPYVEWFAKIYKWFRRPAYIGLSTILIVGGLTIINPPWWQDLLSEFLDITTGSNETSILLSIFGFLIVLSGVFVFCIGLYSEIIIKQENINKHSNATEEIRRLYENQIRKEKTIFYELPDKPHEYIIIGGGKSSLTVQVSYMLENRSEFPLRISNLKLWVSSMRRKVLLDDSHFNEIIETQSTYEVVMALSGINIGERLVDMIIKHMNDNEARELEKSMMFGNTPEEMQRFMDKMRLNFIKYWRLDLIAFPFEITLVDARSGGEKNQRVIKRRIRYSAVVINKNDNND